MVEQSLDYVNRVTKIFDEGEKRRKKLNAKIYRESIKRVTERVPIEYLKDVKKTMAENWRKTEREFRKLFIPLSEVPLPR